MRSSWAPKTRLTEEVELKGLLKLAGKFKGKLEAMLNWQVSPGNDVGRWAREEDLKMGKNLSPLSKLMRTDWPGRKTIGAQTHTVEKEN